jgi:hypothetical protein
METAWLKNFSDTKESFSEHKKETNADFLTTFLKTNPITSVYNVPTDARNEIEPLETIAGSGFDNIKGLYVKTEETEETEETKKVKKDDGSTKNDIDVINDMTLTAVTSLMSLYLAYNLYFNLTVGDKKMLEVEKTLDSIPMKPATNWFVEIVKYINIFVTTSIPTRVKTFIDGNAYFKYRSLFVLFVVLANFTLKPVMTKLTEFFSGLSWQKFKKLFTFNFSSKLNFKNNNIIISILFFFFLTKALYSMFLEQSAGPIVSFIVANPFLFLFCLFIYVIAIYPITVPLSTFVVTCLFIFYGFLSMIYFYYMKSFDATSPYANVSSFSDLFGAINNHMNFGHVVFENQNNMFEKGFAFIFNDIHYLYFLGILASMIPYILKFQSTSMKMYFFALVGLLIAFIGTLKIDGFSAILNIFR